MARSQFLSLEVWTTHFLGTAERGRALLRTLESMDAGQWRPDRWNSVEPIRKPFTEDCQEEIIRRWIEDRPPGSGEVYNFLMFRRKQPRAFIMAHGRRLGTGGMNSIRMEVDAKSFCGEDGPLRLKAMLRELVLWSEAAYGYVYYSEQVHKRIVQMTPLQRLAQAYWLNFFGMPYVEMFGGRRVVQAPCYSVEEVDGHGLLLQTTARFDAPELTDSDNLLIALEEYLGVDAFAGRGYPQIPCRVPRFDLSETVPPS